MFYNESHDGKVGINEESPEKDLHVNGTVYINDILKLKPTSTPASPERGMIYYDDISDKVKVCIQVTPSVIWQDLN